MKKKLGRDWRANIIKVACDDNEMRLDLAWVRRSFGIAEIHAEGSSRYFSYLVHLPTAQSIGVFLDAEIAARAADVAEPLADWTECLPYDFASILRAWVGAGFCGSGLVEGGGDLVWRFAPIDPEEVLKVA